MEPNAVLHRLSVSLFDSTRSPTDRLVILDGVKQLEFGSAVTTRIEFEELRDLVGSGALSPAQIAEAKRLISRLHSLSTVVSRTRKVEVQEKKAVREPHPINVEWTEPERDFYMAFQVWQVQRAISLGLPVAFVTQMPLRLASTCLPGARDKLLKEFGGTALSGSGEEWDVLEDEPDEAASDESGDRTEAPVDPAIPPPALLALGRAMGDRDTKLDRFIEELRPLIAQGKRVLLFTFSRVALAYLVKHLRSEFRIGEMHGGIDRRSRQATMQAFRRHDFDILLASRVASEGLDFEFCSVVVNYDLPWNPMEVEQRIGRIDRFGQVEDKVLVLNFHTPGTIETDIIARVHQRIGVFESSIGELEPILLSRLGDLKQAMFDFRLTDEQREQRLVESLTAIHEQKLTRAEIEVASAYLSSTDNAAIDGLEDRLISTGRYVGQQELVLLLRDWIAGSKEASITTASGGTRLVLRGSDQLEAQLRSVQVGRARSSAEIEGLARRLRDGLEISICLDQEQARLTGEQLLTANNVLVRAALRVPGNAQARFANIRVATSDVAPGAYLVLLGILRWNGIQTFSEMASCAVSLDDLGECPGIGDALLAGLAQGALLEGASLGGDLAPALKRALALMRRRRDVDEERRIRENESLLEVRRLSLRETHQRKLRHIHNRIETARHRGSSDAVRLNIAQRENQDRLFRKAQSDLEAKRGGSMAFEALAVCTVEVES